MKDIGVKPWFIQETHCTPVTFVKALERTFRQDVLPAIVGPTSITPSWSKWL